MSKNWDKGEEITASKLNDQGLKVVAQDTPDLTLKVNAGVAIVDGTTVKYAGGNTPTISAPAANPRIDLITINSSGTIGITAGSENVSPTAPAYPSDKTVLAEVYCKVGMTQIFNTDQGSGKGYIYRDSRPLGAGITLIAATTGASDAGKGIKTDADGMLDNSFLRPRSILLPSYQAIDGTTTPKPVGVFSNGEISVSKADAAHAAIFAGFVKKNNAGTPPQLLHSANVGVGGSYTAPAGTKRIVLVHWLTYGLSGITLPTTCTWNGRTFTKIHDASPTCVGLSTWYCVIGDSGSTENGSLSINGSGRGTTDVFMETYGYVDQASPIAAQNSAGLSSSGATVSITPTQAYSLIVQGSTYRGNPVGIDSRMTVRQNTTQSQVGDGFFKGLSALAIATTGAFASGSEQIATGVVQLKGASPVDTEVLVSGIVDGFSGLTPGAVYYLSNTEGVIGTSAGSTSVKIGRALTATKLLIVQPV